MAFFADFSYFKGYLGNQPLLSDRGTLVLQNHRGGSLDKVLILEKSTEKGIVYKSQFSPNEKVMSNFLKFEAEAETSTDPEPRCRLCLHQWTDKDAADHDFQNIFTEEDDSLPLKIRDCLGVFVSPEDSIRTICSNCRQTVSLIDEFRSLCRQTEEIYESEQIRCEDGERWERYAEYVGELRKLVQEHKDTINEQLSGVEVVERVADEDSISQHFVPMQLVKEEPNGDEQDCGDAPLAMELLEIKPDRPPSDESDGEVNENNETELPDGIGSTSYEQQVKIAQEVLKRLKHFTSNMVNPKQLWTLIAEQMDMEYSAIRTRWNRMKRCYLNNKARVATGGRPMILRLKGCALFNLMNQIVPELDGSIEPWVAPESVDTDDQTQGKSSTLSLKIAIAEEIRNSPELWDRSLASSTHTMDQIWKSIARKFNMDAEMVRLHWRTLQDLYRRHKKRVSKGARDRSKSDRQFYKLIEIMQHIYQANEGEAVKQEQVVEQGMVKEENVLVVLEEHQVDNDVEDETEKKLETLEEHQVDNDGEDETEKKLETLNSQKMTLAKLVYKHQHLWNQKHKDFHNAVARDATWDHIAATLNKTREETKYAWKCLRNVYRCRVKRVRQGLLRPDARVLHDALFKQLELMCAGNKPIGSTAPVTDTPPEASKVSAHEMDESESDEAPKDHGNCDTGKSEHDQNMKLAVLCEKHEIIWNSKHPDNANLKKRNSVWDSIARKMNLTRVQAKAMWTRMMNVYRTRRLRFVRGVIAKNSHLLREPLYRKLDTMCGSSDPPSKSEPSEQTTKTRKGDAGPFVAMEDKVRLVEEVIKHEFLWNTTHPDYFKSGKRGAMWTQISGMFDNCDAWTARSEWRRLRNKHRPRKSCAATAHEPIDDNEQDGTTSSDPLYELFSKMAESLTAEIDGDPAEEGEPSGEAPTKKVKKRRIQEITEAYMTHKRRFTGKRTFDDEGCIKVIKGGIVRYEKICELCGKQIERSYFEYHMNQHYGLKPYVCSIEGCGRQYSNKIERDRHEVEIHSDDGFKFECDQCDEKFKYRSRFDYHYAIKHESQLIPCTICGKLSKHKKVLQRHLAKVHQLSWKEFQTIYGSTSQQ